MKAAKMFIAALALAVASTAFAWPTEPPPPPPPPPPPELNACSPGFWKNHTELWVGFACTGDTCSGWLADLRSRGPGSGAKRQDVADYLNAWADGYYLRVVCPAEE